MDASRIEKTVARIESIDRGRFAEAASARLEAGGLAPLPAWAEAPPPLAPSVQRDRRMLGSWHHSTCYSSGGFSYSNTRSRFFGANGRYVEGSQSFVNMVRRNSPGDDIGQTAANNASADGRGAWSISGSLLTLDADNGDSYEFHMEVYSDSPIFSQPGRDPTLWTRN